MRELDGIRIIGPGDGPLRRAPTSTSRELVSALDTDGRWRLGEVVAEADEAIATERVPGSRGRA